MFVVVYLAEPPQITMDQGRNQENALAASASYPEDEIGLKFTQSIHFRCIVIFFGLT